MSRLFQGLNNTRRKWLLTPSVVRSALFAFGLMGGCSYVVAQEIAPISLVDIGQGQGLSSAAISLGSGGYELSDGTQVRFSDWYHSNFPEVHVDFMTQLTQDFGVLWGVGTGERGQKYTIDPSLRLGFIAQTHPSENSVLSLTLNTTVGGKFSEGTCTADYGDIGGVQQVNCRLAASELPPEETLQYLASAFPNPFRATLSYRANF